MSQRSYLRINVPRQIVQGIYYPHGEGEKRVIRKLFGFAELDFDADGKPLKGRGHLTEHRRSRMINTRYQELQRKVLLEEKNAPKTTAGLPLKEALQAWLDWGTTARAHETVLLMRLAADSLMVSLPPGKRRKIAINAITLRDGDQWLAMMHTKGLAPATINLRIRTINAFFGWALERRMLPERFTIKQIKAQRKLPKILTQEEIKALFERIAHLAQHEVDPRHRRFYRLHLRFLTIAHYTGARSSEIFYLPWVNIALDEGLIYIRSHALFDVKERREKALPIAPALQAFLTQERHAHPAEVWLLDDGGGKLAYHSAAALTLAIKRHMQALDFAGRGIKPIHGHRAALASRLWSDGVDLTTVQKALGHSDIQVTQGYLPDATPVVRAAFESMKDVGVAEILAKTVNKTVNKQILK